MKIIAIILGLVMAICVTLAPIAIPLLVAYVIFKAIFIVRESDRD